MSDDDDAWMDMIEGFPLFDEDGDTGPVLQQTATGRKRKDLGLKPPEPRGTNSNLVGLDNLGATCYMNSLIQAMFFTPGFRDQLFRLTYADLRVPSDGNVLAASARRIPIELQQLLAEMTALDQSAITTKRLVDAFGWSDLDMREQHDVQELNRVLCDAIHRSLVGTPGGGMLPSLYNGVFVWTTQCFKCCDNPSVSEREEPFQDIQQSVVDVDLLTTVLSNSFAQPEKFTGDNKLRCGNCNELADGERSCRLGGPLPAVLTISLNRYSWDLRTGERRKVNSKFAYPTTLDVRPYCTDAVAATLDDESDLYELYSIVLHSGGAGGGHYTALARDFRKEGVWQEPTADAGGAAVDGADSEWVTVGKTAGTGLNQTTAGEDAAAEGVNGAAEATKDLPGKEWFFLNDQRVSAASSLDIEKAYEGSASAYMLFYVRRSHVNATLEASLDVPPEIFERIAAENVDVAVKRTEYEDKINLVQLYPTFATEYTSDGVVINKHPAAVTTAPQRGDDCARAGTEAGLDLPSISIDKRKPISALFEQLAENFAEQLTDLDAGEICLSNVKRMPATNPTWYIGGQIWSHPSSSNGDVVEKTVQDCGLVDGMDIFVWNGVEVGGEHIAVATTDDERPLLVRVTLYGLPAPDGFDEHYVDTVLSPTASIRDVCDSVVTQLGATSLDIDGMVVWKSYKERSEVDLFDLLSTLCGSRTECEISIFVNHESADGRLAELLSAGADAEKLTITLDTGTNAVQNFEYDSHKLGSTVASLKAAILKRMDPAPAMDAVRLRVYLSKSKVFVASRLLLEEWSLDQARVKAGGSNVYIAVEHVAPVPRGSRPVKVQMGQSVVLPGPPDNTAYEIICPPDCTIGELGKLAIAEIGVDAGKKWHLCTTNWNTDRGSAIDDLDSTLDQAHIPANDILLLEMGDIIPRGFVDVNISWHKPAGWGTTTTAEKVESMATGLVGTWLQSAASLVQLPGLMSALDTSTATTLGISTPADCIDSVDIARDRRITPIATLRVKQKVLPRDLLLEFIANMPELAGHPALDPATIEYATEVRIREVKEDRLGKVIVPVNPPSNGAKASLHTTQRLCIEVRVDENDPPVGYKVGMAPPLHLHVARRDRDKRSYHPTKQFTFWPPHTADSLGVQLATFTGIPAADLRVCRFLRKSRTWDQVVPVVAVPQANSQQKRKPRGTARVGKARKKGASKKGAGKKLQLRKNLKTFVKNGDVFGVDVLDEDWKDMSCAADRAEELSAVWLAEQRRIARLMGGRHNWNGGGGSAVAKRYEPVLKIDVPDFEGLGADADADGSDDEDSGDEEQTGAEKDT